MSTKFAVGALIQWYEIDILPEYIDTLIEAIKVYKVDSVLVDLKLVTNQDLEQSDTPERLGEVLLKFQQQLDRLVSRLP